MDAGPGLTAANCHRGASIRERLPHLSSRLVDQRVQVALRRGADVAANLVGAGLGGAPVAPNQGILGEGGGKAVGRLREDPLPLAKAPVDLVEPPFHNQILWYAGDLEVGVLKAPDRPA